MNNQGTFSLKTFLRHTILCSEYAQQEDDFDLEKAIQDKQLCRLYTRYQTVSKSLKPKKADIEMQDIDQEVMDILTEEFFSGDPAITDNVLEAME